MAHRNWPTGSDIERWIASLGLDADTSLSAFYQDAADAAQHDIERATGKQFLADATASSRTFDPPTNREAVLFLPELSTLTTLEYQPMGSDALELTLGTDFITEPRNHAAMDLPIDRVRFLNKRWMDPLRGTMRNSIIVTGKWGAGTALPPDIWLAALADGALWLWNNVIINATGGMSRFAEADVTEVYGSGGQSGGGWTDYLGSWQDLVKRTIAGDRSPRNYF